MAGEIRRELLTWVQYFTIVLVAAAVAGHAYEAAFSSLYEAGVANPNTAYNLREMFKALLGTYCRWWLGVFIGLSALRFSILFLVRRVRNR